MHADGLRISGSMDVLLPIMDIVFFYWNIWAPLAYLNTIFPLQKYTGVSTMCTFQQLPVPAALTLAHFAH
jgi:spore maturation protein SpmB